MNKLTPKRKLSTDVAASPIPKKTKAFPSHILPYTQEELQSFIGNICAGCDDVFTTARLTQTGRPICIDIRTSKLIFCAYCTVYHAQHNAQYLNVGRTNNKYNISKKGVVLDEPSARLLCRLIHLEHGADCDILPNQMTYRIVVVVP